MRRLSCIIMCFRIEVRLACIIDLAAEKKGLAHDCLISVRRRVIWHSLSRLQAKKGELPRPPLVTRWAHVWRSKEKVCF